MQSFGFSYLQKCVFKVHHMYTSIQQTDMDHVYVGLAQACPNCWLNGRSEGRKLSENLSYSLLANAELSIKLLPNSVLIITLVSNLMNVITGSWILLLKA